MHIYNGAYLVETERGTSNTTPTAMRRRPQEPVGKIGDVGFARGRERQPHRGAEPTPRTVGRGRSCHVDHWRGSMRPPLPGETREPGVRSRLRPAGNRTPRQPCIRAGDAYLATSRPCRCAFASADQPPEGAIGARCPGLQCAGMSRRDIQEIPDMFGQAASCARAARFSGVHIHAGHGFLLRQFLSPLFNRREDAHGGSIEARCRIVLEVVDSA